MARLLLVDGRQDMCTEWRAALEARRHEVSVAANASFVLTMLERNPPDVIVSHVVLEDMSGCELCAIVRTDPMARQIRFILLTETRKGASAVAPVTYADSMLPDNVSPACLVRRVEEVLLEAALARVSTRAGEVPEDAAELDGGAPVLDPIRGSLDALDLGDVIQAISDARQRGWLVVRVDGTKGAIAFDAGRPVHAAFRGQTGEQALTCLALATIGTRDASFEFFPGHGGRGPALPRSIEGNVGKLVFEVAVKLDEARRNAEAPQGGGRRSGQV